MPIRLSSLSVDPIIDHEIGTGSLARAVNAERCTLEVGDWRQEFDGVSVLFLLGGIYGAVIDTLLHGRSTGFYCLDDPASGRIVLAAGGRVEISMSDGGMFEVNGFELLAATVSALMEVAEFLCLMGYAEAAKTILISDVACHPAAAPNRG